jgi:hypothetical protein
MNISKIDSGNSTVNNLQEHRRKNIGAPWASPRRLVNISIFSMK